MSFEIRCSLDQPIDPRELLGEIRISDGRVSLLRSSTFVDSWLEAFVEVLRDWEAKGYGRAEIVEEPDVVELATGADGLTVVIGDDRFHVANIDELRGAIQRAGTQLLETSGGATTPVLGIIRGFLTAAREEDSAG